MMVGAESKEGSLGKRPAWIWRTVSSCFCVCRTCRRTQVGQGLGHIWGSETAHGASCVGNKRVKRKGRDAERIAGARGGLCAC